jgi:anti-anti-sigma regulatory factor
MGERPTFQWDAPRGAGAATLRLYGRLGDRELRKILEALIDRVRSPLESVAIDLTGVDHLDFRAVGDFLRALGHLRDRCAAVWLVGASPYIRQLMDVSGQGGLWRALVWDAGPSESTAWSGEDRRAAERRALRVGAWN